jgi:O-antigen/teichoic acid export membrane protein
VVETTLAGTSEATRPPADRPVAGGSLRHAAVSGVKWITASTGAGAALSMVQTLILARLLGPGAFGLMAAAMVIVGFAQMFRDMGITNAIIVRPDVSRESLSSLYWANLASGLAVGGLVMASTPLVVAYYHQSGLTTMMPWMALTFAVGPVGNVFGALLARELQFELIAKIETAASVVVLPVTVGFAAAGAGPVSLALGYLSGCVTRSLLLGVLGRGTFRPMLRFRRADLRGYLSFGGYQMGFGALDYLRSNLDYLMIGRFLGAHALGVYAIAFSFVTKPQTQINPVLTRVATPVFAKRQASNEALRSGYLELLRLIAFISMPLLVGLAIVAPAFVPLAVGARWHAAVLPLEILAFVGICFAIGNPLGSLTLAKNRPDIEFKLSLVLAPLTGIAIFLVVHRGPAAVALVLLAIMLGTLPVLLAILRHLVEMPAREFFAALAAPTILTTAMAAVAITTYHLASLTGSRGVTLAATAAAGAISYAVLLWWREGAYMRELWSLLTKRRARTPAAIPEPLPALGG